MRSIGIVALVLAGITCILLPWLSAWKHDALVAELLRPEDAGRKVRLISSVPDWMPAASFVTGLVVFAFVGVLLICDKKYVRQQGARTET
jgi:hypothetical protein